MIGSNFILDWLAHRDEPAPGVDALTCAGNLAALARLADPLKNNGYGQYLLQVLQDKVF